MQLVKIPSSIGSLGKNIGCENAPDRILKALKDFYSNESGKKNDFEVIDIPVDKNNLEKTHEIIYKNLKEIKQCMIIGGDHSVTYGAYKAFSSNYKNPGLIIFDAHPDLEINTKTITHEDYLRALIKHGYLKRENLILIGIRNSSENEVSYIKENKIKCFDMKTIFNNLDNICDIIMENSRNYDGLYLSIDIDSLDPAFAPGTHYIEPGGLTTRELLYFLHRLKLLKNLKFVDVVEVNPKLDVNNITIKLAAKLINEIL